MYEDKWKKRIKDYMNDYSKIVICYKIKNRYDKKQSKLLKL